MDIDIYIYVYIYIYMYMCIYIYVFTVVYSKTRSISGGSLQPVKENLDPSRSLFGESSVNM